ncbi:hypothetical protein [Streptomyces cadmiisoli]|uniref:hypothetical protein n=1 Tax=Streptomyces cadmiisoli TaxID=2184053 RepID=UPI0013A690B0|nr:hypothetical protein [Streptomyces cadmiisoli]
MNSERALIRRKDHIRTAIIRWLYQDQSTLPAGLGWFLATQPPPSYEGVLITAAEVDEAQGYLWNQGLVEPRYPRDIYDEDVDEDDLMYPRLTAKGVDCAEMGMPVSRFINPTQGGASTTTYNVHNPKGSVIGGSHGTVRQTNNFGFDAAQVGHLLQLATLIRQMAPVLNLPAEEEAELLDGVRELETAASDAPADQGVLRRATDRVMLALTSASEVTGGLSLLIQQGHEIVNAVFGG